MTNPLAALEARLDALCTEWVGAAPAFGVVVEAERGFDDIAAMRDAGLVRVVEVAGGLRRQLDAVLALLAAEVDRRSDGAFGAEGPAKQHGQRNSIQLVASTIGATARQAAMIARVGAPTRPRASFTGGSMPPRRPAVARALASGAIGLEPPMRSAPCSTGWLLERVPRVPRPTRASSPSSRRRRRSRCCSAP